MSDYLPEEVILEILQRLPIKSIVRCTSVCKFWLSLIKNPSFISTHLSRTITSSSSSSTKDPLLLLRHCLKKKETYNTNEHYSLRFDNQEFNHYMHLRFPFNSLNQPCFHIVGSCNGLICLTEDIYSCTEIFILWNPLIGKSLRLPLPPIVTSLTHGPYDAFIGFGFDSRSNDYKVVRMIDPHGFESSEEEAVPQVEIFSLNANSWRNITDVSSPGYKIIHRGSQAFVNGVVHCIGFRRSKDTDEFSNVVLGLDMGFEVLHEISLPECLAHVCPLDLDVWIYGESSIAVSARQPSQQFHVWQQLHVWVMKEYGVVGSWTKILILEEQEGGLPGLLGFRKNGEVLLEMYPGTIASCDPESKHISDLGIQVEMWHTFVDTYVESLVFLDKENVASDTNVASDVSDPSDAN